MHRVGNASARRKGVGVFGSALLRCELAQDGARGFRFGIRCLGVILMTRDGRSQVRIGRIGVGTVMVVRPVEVTQAEESELPTCCFIAHLLGTVIIHV